MIISILYSRLDHLSRALGNLENRLLNEINYLRTMINMLLPPLYQQHYFAQSNPKLYEPLESTTTTTTTTTATTPTSIDNGILNSSNETPESPPLLSDEAENQAQPLTSSPLTISAASTILNNLEENTVSDEAVKETMTERQLKFRPVQKKTNERNKPLPRYLI